MKITKIIQLSASLLLTCGFVRAAECIDPLLGTANGTEVHLLDTYFPPSLPCGNGEGETGDQP